MRDQQLRERFLRIVDPGRRKHDDRQILDVRVKERKYARFTDVVGPGEDRARKSPSRCLSRVTASPAFSKSPARTA